VTDGAFAGFHPAVSLAYFTAVIGLGMFLMHPVSLGVSLVCASGYAVYLLGRKALRPGLLYMLPMVLVTAAMNPLFNHRGATILTYLPNGNPVTLESAAYGIAAAVMLVSVMAWFACFNAVVTSDKLVYLLGRAAPALSLLLSMSLRFVPRLGAQIKLISAAQRGIGRDVSGGNILQRAAQGAKILSISVSWTMEHAMETADSMKARGYGLPGRSMFSIFRFCRRDVYAMAFISLCVAAVVAGALSGAYHFRYFPTIQGRWGGGQTAGVFAAHFALCVFPIIVSLKEELAWKIIRSKG